MIFIDRSVPKSVANALKAVRDDVLWLEDRFPHNTSELVWLPVAGQSDWLVILRDKKVRTRPGERAAIIRNNVGCFIIHQKKSPTKWEYLKLLTKTLDRMEESYRTTPKPFIYKVDSQGNFTAVP